MHKFSNPIITLCPHDPSLVKTVSLINWIYADISKMKILIDLWFSTHLIHPSQCVSTYCTLWRRDIFLRKGDFCLKASRQKNTPIVWLIVAKYTTVICTQKKSQPKKSIVPRATAQFGLENFQYFIIFLLLQSTFVLQKY